MCTMKEVCFSWRLVSSVCMYLRRFLPLLTYSSCTVFVWYQEDHFRDMNWLQAAKEGRDRLIADQDDRLKEGEAQREELVEQVEHLRWRYSTATSFETGRWMMNSWKLAARQSRYQICHYYDISHAAHLIMIFHMHSFLKKREKRSAGRRAVPCILLCSISQCRFDVSNSPSHKWKQICGCTRI